MLSRLRTGAGNNEERKPSGVGTETYSAVTGRARPRPTRGTEETEPEEPGGHPWPVGDDWIDYDVSYDRWHDHGGYETPRVSDDDQEIADTTKHIEQSTTMPNTQFPP